MSTQTRLAKIESQVDGVCPICGTDRRGKRAREVEILAGSLGRAWREGGKSPEGTLAWLRANVPSVIEILQRDRTIAADAIVLARANAPTQAELAALAEKQVAIYEKHVTRDVALKLLREESSELADLLA